MQMFTLRASCQCKALIQVCNQALSQFVLPLYLQELFAIFWLDYGFLDGLDSYFSQEVLHMTGIQISMCVQLSGLEIVLYDCLDEVLV